LIMKNNNGSQNKVMSTALNLLGRKQMTVCQLAKRLKEKGFPHEEIDEAVQKLTEWKYLDDHHYALTLIRSKSRKYSKRKTASELVKAGIEKDFALQLLETNYSEDQEVNNCLRQVRLLWDNELVKWEKKYKNTPKYQNIPREVFLKKRIADKLVMKGFSTAVIKKAFSIALQSNL